MNVALKFAPLLVSTIILVLCSSPYAGALPDTGQTKCFDNQSEITCPQPGEPFYGQDGSYLINSPSYTKLDGNGDELPVTATSWVMVRDNITGLIWEVKTDDDSIHDKDRSYSWQNAKEIFVQQLNDQEFGKNSDWRLPTISELSSLVNISAYDPAVDSDYFPNTLTSGYWSLTSDASDTEDAWYTYFSDGYGYRVSKSFNWHVRGVRGGKSPLLGELIVNSDHTVTDVSTGLMWQQATENPKEWSGALTYCNNLKLGDYEDWRLPNRMEFGSIVDYSTYDPAVDKTAFPDTVSSYYWSSTTDASDSQDAWIVDLDDGWGYWGSKSYSHYVRAVRGGQVWLPGHLLILVPQQGSIWTIGDSMPIKWEPQNIGGTVNISLSHMAGKVGSFDEIVSETENDGIFHWTVIGSASFNCVLKVEPVSDPSKATTQGLFSIVPRAAPGASTGEATNVTSQTATLDGTVNAHWCDTTVVFEYGRTTAYGFTSLDSRTQVGGEGDHLVSAQVTGLSPATTYHFRITATSQGGTAYGNDATFTTSGNSFCISSVVEFETALNTAATNGKDDTICVIQGTYQGNFSYGSYDTGALVIEGGYKPGCLERVLDPKNTILDGGGTDSVMILNTQDAAADFKVEGFTFRNGSAATYDAGGGIYAKTLGDVTISHNIFSENSGALSGGGIYLSGSGVVSDNAFTSNTAEKGGGSFVATATLNNNTFFGNAATQGGAVYCSSSATFSGNSFARNTATADGGGVYGSGTATGNDFNANVASGNGGGFFSSGPAILIQNLFSENTADKGGGIYFTGYKIITTNCTVANNKALSQGGGIWAKLTDEQTPGKFFNNILWHNEAPKASALYLHNVGDDPVFVMPVELFNNDFDQSAAGTVLAKAFEIDNSNLSNQNPMFLDSSNFNLMSGSPCINKGDNEAPNRSSKDKHGNPRIVEEIIDMGVYEYNPLVPKASAGPDQRVDNGQKVTLNGCGSSDPRGETLWFNWRQTQGSPPVALSNASSCSTTFTATAEEDSGILFGFELAVTNLSGLKNTDTVLISSYDAVFYVKKDGLCGGKMPCYNNIQAAVDAAPDFTVIKIAQGDYTGQIALKQNKTLSLRGGWNVDWEQQTANRTTIKAPSVEQGTLQMRMLRVVP